MQRGILGTLLLDLVLTRVLLRIEPSGQTGGEDTQQERNQAAAASTRPSSPKPHRGFFVPLGGGRNSNGEFCSLW